jgi:hypothetical protein
VAQPPLRYIAAVADTRRWLLIWWMVVLLPLQGWAAAAGLPCALGPHAPPKQAALQGERAAHDHAHLQAQPATPQHAVVHEHPDAVAASAADDDAPAGAGSARDDGAHTCSACAACCPGAAPPSAAVTVPVLPSADAVAAAPCPGTESAPIGGLERPPRSIVG